MNLVRPLLNMLDRCLLNASTATSVAAQVYIIPSIPTLLFVY
jgi:hypothetical protein